MIGRLVLLTLGSVLSMSAPVVAQQLSGGGSGGGAIQGGSGAPGSGVGIPGSIVNNTTAWGIGQDSTYDPRLMREPDGTASPPPPPPHRHARWLPRYH